MNEQRYAGIIILAYFVGMFILIALFFYFGMIVMGAEHDKAILYMQCNALFLGDNITTGYNTTLAASCWNNFK